MPHFVKADTYPSFPTDVPTAPLKRLSIAKLVTGDLKESKALFDSCTSSGFFLLDLQDHDFGVELLKTVDPIFAVAEDLFELDLSEKDAYSYQAGEAILGYKGYGVGRVDNNGTPDRCEFWAVGKDDILGISAPQQNPQILNTNRANFKSFIDRGHALCELISSHLDKHLGLPPDTLASHQRLTEPSSNQVRLIKSPPQCEGDRRTSFLPHTDLGSITVLFNVLGGLQILPPGLPMDSQTGWQFVAPQKGCAIINMGDAMTQWTNGALKSSVHRVTYAPGLQASHTRYAVAYFARAEDDTVIGPLEQSPLVRSFEGTINVERGMTAKQWAKKKGAALRTGRNKPNN